MRASDRIWVALDTPDLDTALQLADRLSGAVGGYKVGLELYGAHGPRVVEELRRRGAGVFVDLKLHDIPNTVAGSAAALARLGVSLFTMHALGGPTMLTRGVEAADRAADEAGVARPTGLAVTILTSHSDAELDAVGVAGPCSAAVLRLAGMARDAGAGGLVCSPLEIRAVREVFREATLVVPGIRPASTDVAGDDQTRKATPARAVADGADRLVIGRPITRADDPLAAAQAIAAEIERG
ncbi:MAG: orotidine-5'-phosphate decarboxylase [bacterium]|nr:orotidine-5'-phosphate decarboxylase [bacterium]